ncbi:uncharacterized protein AAES06_025310 isoform 1-T1 [Glossophaga mutica]
MVLRPAGCRSSLLLKAIRRSGAVTTGMTGTLMLLWGNDSPSTQDSQAQASAPQESPQTHPAPGQLPTASCLRRAAPTDASTTLRPKMALGTIVRVEGMAVSLAAVVVGGHR